MADSQDLSMPKWLYAVLAGAALTIGVAAWLIVRNNAPPPIASAPTTSVAKSTAAPQPKRPATPPVAVSPSPLQTEVARALAPPAQQTAIVPASRGTIGRSLHQIINGLEKLRGDMIGPDHNDLGEKLAQMRIAVPGGSRATLAFTGEPADLHSVSVTFAFLNGEREVNAHNVAFAQTVMQNAMPGLASTDKWLVASVNQFGKDPQATPSISRNGTKASLIGLPSNEGALFVLCFEPED